MAYGMQQLRKAGDALRNFDAKYADKVNKVVAGENPGMVRGIAGMAVGSPIGEGYNTIKADGPMGKALATGALAGLDASNVAVRYGLPAAGLTAAGMALGEQFKLTPEEAEQYGNQFLAVADDLRSQQSPGSVMPV